MTGTVSIMMVLADEIDEGAMLIAIPDGTPAGVDYRWQRRRDGDWADIVENADENAYTVVAADRLHTIRVVLSHADFLELASDPTDTVPGPHIGVGAIEGVPLVGQVLTANTDGIAVGGDFTYRWYRGVFNPDHDPEDEEQPQFFFTQIAGQNAATYTLVEADVGHYIRLAIERVDAVGTAHVMSDGAAFVAFRQVALGAAHTLAIAEDGSLWAWGSNFDGRLGVAGASVASGAAGVIDSPRRVGTGTDWVLVSAGNVHSIGIRGVRNTDGTVRGSLWAWGGNSSSVLGQVVGPPGHLPEPSQVGIHEDWIHISASGSHNVGIRDESSGGNVMRTLWAWGTMNNNRLGTVDPQPPPEPFMPVATPTRNLGAGAATDWVFVSAGDQHNLGIRQAPSGARTLWAWGNGGSGRLGNGVTTQNFFELQVHGATEGADSFTDWVYASAGGSQSSGIRGVRNADGTVKGTLWTWGLPNDGRLGHGEPAVTLSRPAQVGAHDDWVAVNMSGSRAMGIREEAAGVRTLWAWGDGANFGTGLGPNEEGATFHAFVPMQVGSHTGWASLGVSAAAATQHHGAAIRIDGSLWTWGHNNNGQTGIPGVPFGAAANNVQVPTRPYVRATP